MTRDPNHTPFKEVFYEFGRGTLSTSSCASRRRNYMSFSNHHRSQYITTPSKGRSGYDDVDVSTFDRIQRILMKSHFAALFTALVESGLLSSTDRDILLGRMDRPDFDKSLGVCWMRHYAKYSESRDLSSFLISILQ